MSASGWCPGAFQGVVQGFVQGCCPLCRCLFTLLSTGGRQGGVQMQMFHLRRKRRKYSFSISFGVNAGVILFLQPFSLEMNPSKPSHDTKVLPTRTSYSDKLLHTPRAPSFCETLHIVISCGRICHINLISCFPQFERSLLSFV